MTGQSETGVIDPPQPAVRARDIDPISAKLASLQIKSGERRGGKGFRWGRLILFGLVGVAAVAAYVGYDELRKAGANEIEHTEAITFGERAGGGVILEFSGYIVPHTKIAIAPQAAGQITFLPIQEGMKVSKGDILCKIEEERYMAEFERANGSLKLAQAQLDEIVNGALPEEREQLSAFHDAAIAREKQTKEEFDRIKALYEQQNVSQREFDAAQVAFLQAQADVRSSKAKLELVTQKARPERVAAAEAQVEQAKAAVKQAQVLLNNAIIKAPIDGTILEKNAQEGELILPETVIRSFCVLADMNALEAEVDIPERDVAKVSIGHPCQVIADAYPDRTFEAQLDRMQPQVNRQAGVVPVKVRILNPDESLLANMNCRVLFLKKDADKSSDVPTVPSRAVVTQDGKSTVFVLTDKEARGRSVLVGRKLGDEVEILEGLKAGEVVLLPGKTPLIEGQIVNPKLIDENSATGTP